MRASAILQHFDTVRTWLDPERTVDKIIIGDPEREVTRVLVTWMSTFEAVREAVARGCQLVVTHEPTFWNHANEVEESGALPHPIWHGAFEVKRRFLLEHQLTILRCHDVWDFMPEIGIPFAWARFLGLGNTPAATGQRGALHRYDIEPTTVEAFAQRVAARTATIGEPAVQVVGPLDTVVSRIGVGTGCYCDPVEFEAIGCDLSITCDDGNWYWQNLQCAADRGHPVLRVNHGTSEEPGMVTLAQYLRETFPTLQVEHLPHGSCFRLVGGGGGA